MISICTGASIKISYKLKPGLSFIICRHVWHLLKFRETPFFVLIYLITYKKPLLIKVTDSSINRFIIQTAF